MKSFNKILSDIHEGKEVNNEELKMALLLAETQLTLSNLDINRCLDFNFDRQIVENEVCKNRNQRNLHKQISIERALEINKIKYFKI